MVLTESFEREKLKVMSLEYVEEEDGNFLTEPVVQLFCRDKYGDRRLIEIEGFHPFFYISEGDYVKHQEDLFTDTRVRYIEAREGLTDDENIHNDALREREGAPRKTLHGENLVRIFTVVPGDVGEFADEDTFEKTWEADVFFTNRFLVNGRVTQGIDIPRGEERIEIDMMSFLDPDRESAVRSLPDEEVPDVPPRMLTIDIEVWSGDRFPDTTEARKPITAVTVHDSYDDKYRAGILRPKAIGSRRWDGDSWENDMPDWEVPDTIDEDDVEIRAFDEETEMLGWINNWIARKDPDLLTGWNSSPNEKGDGFDYPYWLNRCERISEWSFNDIAATDTCFVSKYGDPVVGGREMFDMLQAYRKTQIHEKRSYALDYIAEEEVGYGKEDIEDLDTGWVEEPVKFLRYNIRDVEAVVEIERTKNVIEMYDHIRSISGATYSEIADSNIGIIDILYLRRANNRGIALPTSVRPDVQHYWGAYVFDPIPGKHKNVVYPDLSSLYPNLFRDMNASPETIIGFEDDLEQSGYTKDDCHTIYVDTRDESTKKEADEPERDTLYVLKPEVKESFVRETIQDLIDMKYEYKKDKYSDEAYEAVKRITNSVYGVMGDSKSYGVGFRLFDWRIAEAITLAGRDIIKHTANTFVDEVQRAGYPDAEIIAGDTDSCVCTIPRATSMEEALDVSFEAAEYVDDTYDEYMENRYHIDDTNMAVEIESYSEAALFMRKKKRYAQLIKWDEGEEVDEIEVKGFELVRSDSSPLTAEVQHEILERILRNDDEREAVEGYLKEWWDDVTSGNTDLERVGVPSAINRNVWTYGYSKKDDGRIDYYTPQPHVRGARYATAFIDGENISSGKPLMFYSTGVRGSEYPPTYAYENKLRANDSDPDMVESGKEVDAIAVEDVYNLPDDIGIDWEKMADKIIRKPIEPIVDVMGWDFDDLVTDGRQSDMASFM